jgi:hypothetical protein
MMATLGGTRAGSVASRMVVSSMMFEVNLPGRRKGCVAADGDPN